MAPAEKKRAGITGFNFLETQCVWTRARVTPNKSCDSAFDCMTCAFDKGMQKKMARESRRAGWNTNMIALPLEEQRCRHALTGRAPTNKLCCRSFECGDCPYDQMLEDMIRPDHTLMGPPEYLIARGYRVPRNYYLHSGHTWARIEYGGRVRVGLDDFAAKLVGPVERFLLPPIGARFKPGEESFSLERDGNSVRLKAPLGGVVTAVNLELRENPRLFSDDPYGAGWVMVLEPTDLRAEVKELPFGPDATPFIESEAERLRSILKEGSARSEGEEPLNDVYGAFKNMGWDKLVRAFL
jgi:glycine cleavage system H lipoate-binding protein